MNIAKAAINAVLLVLLGLAAWAAFAGHSGLKQDFTTCEERGGERIEGTLGGCIHKAEPHPRAEEILREIEEEEQSRRAFGEYEGPRAGDEGVETE